jgi:peptide/nickel transport system permease protein
MRTCDVFLAIPNLILAIAVMAVLGPNTFNLVMVLTFSGWVQLCKVIRNNVMVIKKQEFVQASKALGAKGFHIMFRQIFPNVTTNMLIIGSQRFGITILLESTLSFLNLGVQPPAPSWGNMISAGRQYLATQSWVVLAPGFALMLTVLAFNFLGDGLRDVLDPKRKA